MRLKISLIYLYFKKIQNKLQKTPYSINNTREAPHNKKMYINTFKRMPPTCIEDKFNFRNGYAHLRIYFAHCNFISRTTHIRTKTYTKHTEKHASAYFSKFPFNFKCIYLSAFVAHDVIFNLFSKMMVCMVYIEFARSSSHTIHSLHYTAVQI